jgi:hypothetical protein
MSFYTIQHKFPAASTCTSTGCTSALSMPRAVYASTRTFAPIPQHSPGAAALP